MSNVTAWKRDQFPVQSQPLYRFMIKNGRLCRKASDRYVKTENAFRAEYRIYAAPGIKTKTGAQLGKVLNGQLWTLDPDPRKAVQAFRERASSDRARAKAMLQAADDARNEIFSAEQYLNSEGIVEQ